MKSLVPAFLLVASIAAFVACNDNGASAESDSVAVDSGSGTGNDSANDPAHQNSTNPDSGDAGQNGVEPAEPYVPGFNPCRFNFGAAWQAAHEDADYYRGLDYVAVWLGDNDWYNQFEKNMVETCLQIHATPMIYAYVIAEFGKDHGLVDCNMATEENPNTLCMGGANLIRAYFADSILYRYEQYASGMRDQIDVLYRGQEIATSADEFESIWLIEPDFYQYSESASLQKAEFNGDVQEGGGIPDAEMGYLFYQIVSVIKKYLPAAKIAIDISPWISDWNQISQAAWYANFDMSLIDYASTSGGGTNAGGSKIRAGNKATWKEIYEVTGKPVLADAGYDRGGAGTGHAEIWDYAHNINARAAEYVVGVMQMDAAMDYAARVDTIRPQLKVSYPWCATAE